MNSYNIGTRPTTQLVCGPRLPALTGNGLITTVAGVTVRDFITHAPSYHEIYLDLQRGSHQAVLDELADALLPYGLDVSEAVAQEWLTAAAEGAVLGGGTGFVAGGRKSNNLLVAIVSGLVGLGVGAALGSLQRSLVAEFDARRYQAGAPWVLTRRTPPPAAQPGFAY